MTQPLSRAHARTVLALLVFPGIPARRNSWRTQLGVLVLLAGIGTLSACGGAGSELTENTTTSQGSCTFQVTGTANDPASVSQTVTFTLTVNYSVSFSNAKGCAPTKLHPS